MFPWQELFLLVLQILKLQAVTTVNGVVDGALPTATFDANDLRIVTTKLTNSSNSGNDAGKNHLFSILPNQ